MITRPMKRLARARRAFTLGMGLEHLERRTVLSSGTYTGSLLVGLGGASEADVAAQAKRLGATLADSEVQGVIQAFGSYLALSRFQKRVMAIPGIEYAEPRQTFSIDATPNDPQYSDGTQWGLNGTYGINAPTAWNTSTGSTKTTVAVIDTGVDYNHPDLYQNIWINQGEIPASRRANLIDEDGDGKITFYDLNYQAADGSKPNQGIGKITDQNGDGRITAADLLVTMGRTNGVDNGTGGWADGISNDGAINGVTYVDDIVGWNFVSNTNNPFDDNGHGTHVSGIIGATGNNGVGVSGVNWQVQIMPLKILNSAGNGTDTAAAAALRYSAAMGAKVSNNSYGGSGTISSTFDNAIAAAASAGSVFVAAAGNSSTNTDVSPSSPSGSTQPNVISVASIDSDGSLSWFSNYGATTVDIAAPGGNIYSTLPGNSYGYMSGTSMATPFVTGAAALLATAHSDWTYTQIVNQILSTAKPLASLTGKVATGGELNLGAALPTTTPPPTPTATANYLGSNTTTQGTWSSAYGASGYALAGSASNLDSSYGFSVSGAGSYVWADASSDSRALQVPGSSNRVAAAWYSSGSFTVALDLGSTAKNVALYFLDWDGSNRSERVDVLDAGTGIVLDSRSISSFANGVYLSWALSGKVVFRIANTGGPNALLNGLFIGGPSGSAATANYLGNNTTTQGTWSSAYGASGYALAGSATNLDSSYGFSVSGAGSYVWTDATSDSRALQTPGSSNRIAAAWYSSGSFTVALDLGSTAKNVALYFLDWDGSNRNQQVDVLDAGTGAVLDSRSISSFASGVYLSWALSGKVVFRIANTGGPNALLNGLFIGGPSGAAATANYLGNNTTTQGTWSSAYGASGYALAGSASNLDSSYGFSVAGASPYVWTDATSDSRALQTPGSSNRIAAAWYSSGSFTVALDLGSTAKNVALYFLDWDGSNRNQQVDVLDAGTGAVLDSRSISSFASGVYLSWALSGKVVFRIANTGGPNALLNGLFIGGPSGAAATANYLGTDATTQGTWTSAYGASGYTLAGSASNLDASYGFGVAGAGSYIWSDASSDSRALQVPGSSNRVAAVWYSNSAFTVTLDLGSTAKNVALYFLDWDGSNRNQQVDVLDASTGAVLDSRSISSFSNGVYLSWALSGKVVFRIANTGGPNALLNGLFIG
ncbi:S8 family serine peptidase [Paludisphaera rhizosphaerae]|uniref:S8 family serine peptidase n=1 Tax=Paludisphaera rhizosphaerae TaxID=2711216 RepID=UPI001980822A|nr:S8 family serine peptidase [Paludisphaera rhizosphaerae]